MTNAQNRIVVTLVRFLNIILSGYEFKHFFVSGNVKSSVLKPNTSE